MKHLKRIEHRLAREVNHKLVVLNFVALDDMPPARIFKEPEPFKNNCQRVIDNIEEEIHKRVFGI